MRLVKAKHASGQITLPFEVGKVPGRAKYRQRKSMGKCLARQFREAFPTDGLRRWAGAGIAKRRRSRD